MLQGYISAAMAGCSLPRDFAAGPPNAISCEIAWEPSLGHHRWARRSLHVFLTHVPICCCHLCLSTALILIIDRDSIQDSASVASCGTWKAGRFEYLVDILHVPNKPRWVSRSRTSFMIRERRGSIPRLGLRVRIYPFSRSGGKVFVCMNK